MSIKPICLITALLVSAIAHAGEYCVRLAEQRQELTQATLDNETVKKRDGSLTGGFEYGIFLLSKVIKSTKEYCDRELYEESTEGKERRAAEAIALAEADAEDTRRKNRPGARIGMNARQILEKTNWGKPNSINRTVSKAGVNEQWVYSNQNYLYFENNELTSISINE